jgi:hypothetical protein
MHSLDEWAVDRIDSDASTDDAELRRCSRPRIDQRAERPCCLAMSIATLRASPGGSEPDGLATGAEGTVVGAPAGDGEAAGGRVATTARTSTAIIAAAAHPMLLAGERLPRSHEVPQATGS